MLRAKATSPHSNSSMKCFQKCSEIIQSLYTNIPIIPLLLSEISVLMHNFSFIEASIHSLGCTRSESIHVLETRNLLEDLFLSQTKR